MNIRYARLCPECDEIFDSRQYKQCPRCGMDGKYGGKIVDWLKPVYPIFNEQVMDDELECLIDMDGILTV